MVSVKEFSYTAEEKFGEIVKGKTKWEDYWGRDKKMDFNKIGNLIKKVEYNWPVMQLSMLGGYSEIYKDMITTYRYDSIGNLKDYLMIYSDSSFYSKSVYKYDKYGKLIELKWYRDSRLENSSERDTYRYFYNEDGQIIFEEKLDFQDRRINLTLNSYNEKGQIIKDETYYFNLDCFPGEWEYEYDELGNLIEKNQMTGRYIDSKTTYKYDNLQNPIEKIEYDSDGKIDSKREHKYEFDKIGNWVKRIDIIDDIPQYILIREIEYK